MYGAAAARVLVNARPWTRPSRAGDGRHIFIVGSPRSGTTFFAGVLGRQPGLVDLSEVKPLKATIPSLVSLPADEAARRLRRTLDLVRRLGLASGMRAVEQTPETSFVLAAALRAYPRARAIHLIRDGRDVVCSLLERGWLSARREDADDAGLPYGVHARFWVEEERRDEFARASEATRAAWAWRRYLTAARSVESDRVLELRYEELVADPQAVASRVAAFLELDAAPLVGALHSASDTSVGRWQRELTPEQVADVEREAGDLLGELGYSVTGSDPVSSQGQTL